jgi:hypothetical protein
VNVKLFSTFFCIYLNILKILEDKGDYYHPTCFICSQCNTSIASKSFYHQSKSDDRQSEAKFLCENCHIKNAQECAECKNKIVSGEASMLFNYTIFYFLIKINFYFSRF